MTDSILLRSKLLSSCCPVRQIAVLSGLSEATLEKKIRGKSEFRASEIVMLSALLNLNEQEKSEIFFAPNSDY